MVDTQTALFLLDNCGINSARTFLGSDPLPDEVAIKVDADRKESRRKVEEVMEKVNVLLAPYGARL